MQARDKERVEAVMNAADKAVDGAKNGSKKSRSTSNAEAGKGLISEKISKARRKVADAAKAQIIGGGLSDALQEIAMGDFGDVGEAILVSFDEFIDGFDQDVKVLKSSEDPKFLLSASADGNGNRNFK